MASTGWKFPGTMVGNRAVSGGDIDWSNPDNCKADDENNASVILDGTTNSLSNGLAASNFDFSGIPAGATIDGIRIRIGEYVVDDESPGVFWNAVNLILADDSDGTENKQAALADPTETETIGFAGGPGDLWSEIITRADVVDVDFGVFVVIQSSGISTTTTLVDHISINVYYHEGLPTTINNDSQYAGFRPPFKSAAGNFYVLATNSPGADVYKATDPESSWSAVDASNSPITNASGGLTAHASGDLIHCAWEGSNGDYTYGQFDMSDDTWLSSTGEAITSLGADRPINQWMSITARANGDVILAYNGENDRVMGGDKERVDYAIRPISSETWDTVDAALDGGGDIHYGNVNCVLGGNGVIHFLWQLTTNTDDPPTAWESIEGVALSSGDSLGTTDSSSGDTSDALLGMPQALYWGTSEHVLMTGFDTTNLAGAKGVQSSNELILETSGQGETFGSNACYMNGEVSPATFVELDDELHCLYSGGGITGSEQDIYYTTSADEGDSWATETEELDGVTCNFISGAIYVRDSSTVFAYVYDDAGVTKYNEKILIAGGDDLAVTIPSILTVAADLDALGELTATQAIALTVVADLDAAGKLEAAIALALSLLADLDAAGKLDTTLSAVLTVAADLDAIGELNTTLSTALTILGDVTAGDPIDLEATLIGTLTVAADLDALGELTATQAFALTVAADLSAQGKLEAAIALALSLLADLDAAGKLDTTLSAVLTVAADLDAAGKLDTTLSAALTILGDVTAGDPIDLEATLIGTLTVAADLDALGELTATQAFALTVAADLSAQGKLEAAVILALTVAADLDAAGKLEAATALQLNIVADLDAAGELSATPTMLFTIAADLSATGSLQTTILSALTLVADIKPQGDLAAILTSTFDVVADLDALGELTATQAFALTVAADLDAAGKLEAAVILALTVAADLDAAGKLEAATALQLNVVADLDAAGELSATPTMLFTIAADLSAAGSLQTTILTALTVTANITLGQDLTATLASTLNVVADLDALGDLTATQVAALTVAADLSAQGRLETAAIMALLVAADLDAAGKLEAATALQLSVAADLDAAGMLSATPAMLLTIAANLDAAGSLDVAIASTSSISAVLVDGNAGPVPPFPTKRHIAPFWN